MRIRIKLVRRCCLAGVLCVALLMIIYRLSDNMVFLCLGAALSICTVIFYGIFSRCPNCGGFLKLLYGNYCPLCGEKLEDDD